MGGYGSGRPGSGRRTTGDMWKLDVRRLKREGLLTPGRCSTVSWSHNGQKAASISIIAHADRVTLKYRSRLQDGDKWEDKEYPVALQWTACHLGGRRLWFLCPCCGRRVAVLWGGRIYACRHCHRLSYPCQREAPHDRLLSRALKIRDRLGWKGDWGLKPKGMHQKTFDRLVREYRRLDEAAASCLAMSMVRM
jgi:hypothetical protein